jgi:flagellar protein FliS
MTTEMTYRKSSIAGATTIGLIIALFDTLVGDFRRASAALRNSDIEARCKELNHAALVLGQLESWVDLKNGGESARTMARFYAFLRAKMLEASAKKSAQVLETQIDLILHVRSAWQQLDSDPASALEGSDADSMGQMAASYGAGPEAMPETVRFSQSA